MSSNGSVPHFKSEEIIAEYRLKDSLEAYLDILFEHNKKMNLVSRETSRPALIRVAADCLVPFKFSEPPGGKFFDIGSGGGFPGIVLLLAFNNLQGILYERTQKKARFLGDVVKELKLKAEIRPDDWPGKAYNESRSFDLGAMKLVKIDRKILGPVESLLKAGGRFIYYAAVPAAMPFDSESMKLFRHDYYLDDSTQLRNVSIFLRS